MRKITRAAPRRKIVAWSHHSALQAQCCAAVRNTWTEGPPQVMSQIGREAQSKGFESSAHVS